MKGLTSDERTAALDSFSPFEDAPKLAVLDRSTLEAWSECPYKAHAITNKLVAPIGELAEIGEQVHQVFGRATKLWVESAGAYNPTELRQQVEFELLGSRPDLQPKVIAACKASIYSWTQFIFGIDPSNIRHFDGGETLGRSGQLALDVESAGVRLTSEVDLIYSGPSKELLHEVDYKSGHKFYTAKDVAESFQFTLHAMLVFGNYEQVNGLEVQVWNTRTNNRTFRVVFYRDKLAEYKTRIMSAVGVWYEHRDNPSPPTWPTWEHCSICDAAAICPEATTPIGDVAKDPAAALQRFAAIEANYDVWKKALTAYVDKHGDIISGSDCFGRAKPGDSKRKPATLYQLKGTKDGESQDSD